MTTTNDSHGPGRYQPLGPDDRKEMLDAIGVAGIDDLFSSIPEALQFRGDLPVEDALSEPELIRHLGELADANGAALQDLVFAAGKDNGYAKEELREWFKAIYEVLLGSSQGPRFGSFVELYGVENTRALIAKGLKGELASDAEAT